MTGTVFLEASELSIGERDGQVFVPVVRTGDLSGAVRIEYGITADTALDGLDFNGGVGTVTMAPGVARVLIPVEILDDGLGEATENFVVSLINLDSGFLQAPRTARVAILDDETPAVDPTQPPLVSDFDVTQQTVVGNLTQPIDFEFSPVNAAQAYVAEKGGLIKVVDIESGATVSEFIDLTAEVNNIQDRGLLDIALHPNFPNEPFVYAFYVVDPPETAGNTGNAGPNGGGNRFSYVVRLEADASNGYLTVVEGSQTILLGGAGTSLSDISGGGAIDSTSNRTQAESGIDPVTGDYIDDYIKVDSRSHAGGALAFGPDGALYVSTGDGTSFNYADPRTVSVQDLTNLAGKILRIDPDTGLGLPDNPFVEPGDDLGANQSKVYQLGLRNPFSMGFDADGQLFITDTGWNSFEELNAGPAGANFGWPFYEGGDNGVLRQTPGYSGFAEAADFYAAVASGEIDITASYRAFSHSSNDPGFQFQSIIGGNVVYSGDRYPSSFANDYFFTDFSDGEVFAVDTDDRRELKFLYETASGFGPVHFTQGPDGYVYYADLVGGAIGRLLIDSDEPVSAPGSLTASYFSIPAGIAALTEIQFPGESANPNAQLLATETVDGIAEASTTGGFFTGGPSDNFAAIYTGAFTTTEAGAYTFYLTSDDGSRLFIDGVEIIDNDGLTAARERSASVTLTEGRHTIEVRYFEAGGVAVADLDWAGPGFARQQMVFEPQPPVALDDAVETAPGVATALVDLLANDGDPDGDAAALRIVAVNGETGAIGAAVAGSNGGQFTVGADGLATFDPAGDFVGLAPGESRTSAVEYFVADADNQLAAARFEATVTAPQAGGSLVTVIARGQEGGETIQLLIDEAVVATYSDLTLQNQSFTYQAPGTVAPDQVRVAFINDFYDPANGIDRNAVIESISIDGRVFPTDDPSVFSTGTWRNEDGITPGFGRGEILAANGYFQYAEPGQAGSAITIFAAGQEGEENMQLLIGGTVVATYEVVPTEGAAYVYESSRLITPDQVRVAFTNDAFDPANGIDRNLVVDRIEIDGQTYETEDESVFSTGSWRAEDGITPGFGRGETLATNGYFQYAEPGQDGSTITIYAAGQEGEENMQLLVDGIVVATYEAVPTEGAAYVYESSRLITADQVRVAFTNDAFDPANGIDRNLVVDRIEIDGQTFETEDASVFSTGTWRAEDGITPGFGRGEILATNGYFEYDQNVGTLSLAGSALDLDPDNAT